MMLAKQFEKAFIGYTSYQPNRPCLAIYDTEKCIQILMDDDRMTQDEAMEWFEFNTVGSWVGDHTPIFLNRSSIEEFKECYQ